MSCPTCDHTMQNLGTWFWCPRCGTIKPTAQGTTTYEAPRLVDRVRTAVGDMTYDDRVWADALGIVESIYPPDQRHGERAKAESNQT
jgi:hypothetical protein